jgi:hypothetical protein
MINNITIVFIFSILLISCEKIKDIFKKEIEQKCFEQSEIGRYQIVLGTIGMKQTYMIDTKTGRIWTLVVDNSRFNDPCLWSEDYVENNKNSYFDYNLFNSLFPIKKSIDMKGKK